jgi:hypothetical protein
MTHKRVNDSKIITIMPSANVNSHNLNRKRPSNKSSIWKLSSTLSGTILADYWVAVPRYDPIIARYHAVIPAIIIGHIFLRIRFLRPFYLEIQFPEIGFEV